MQVQLIRLHFYSVYLTEMFAEQRFVINKFLRKVSVKPNSIIVNIDTTERYLIIQVQQMRLQENSVHPMEISVEQRYVIKGFQIKISVEHNYGDSVYINKIL